ncbi:hypothetical protein ACIXIR_18365 [Bacteroides fragilis]
MNQNQRENSLFSSEVHLFPIRCEGTKISGIFHQLMSTKSKMQSRGFCSQKKKQAVSLVDFGKSTGLFGGAISFLPLF